MNDNFSYEEGFKYRPDYEWPKLDEARECPRCGDVLEIVEDKPTYYGKPFWCAPCQWQFSIEDLEKAEIDSKEEE